MLVAVAIVYLRSCAMRVHLVHGRWMQLMILVYTSLNGDVGGGADEMQHKPCCKSEHVRVVLVVSEHSRLCEQRVNNLS